MPPIRDAERWCYQSHFARSLHPPKQASAEGRIPPWGIFVGGFQGFVQGAQARSPWPCPGSRGLGEGGQGPGGGSGSGIPAGWRSAVPRTSRHTTRVGAHRDPAGTDDCGGAGHDGKGRAGKSAAQGSHICSPTPAQTGRHPRQPQPVPVPVPYPAGSHVGKTRNQRREPHAICHQCAGPPACSKCGAAPAAPITVALVRWWRLCGHGQSGKQLNDEFGVRLLPAAGEETVPSRDAIRSAESVADRIARPNLAGRMSGIQARPRSASHAATAGVTPMRGHLKPCRLRAGHQHPGRGYRPGRRQSEPRAGCRRSAAASPR